MADFAYPKFEALVSQTLSTLELTDDQRSAVVILVIIVIITHTHTHPFNGPFSGTVGGVAQW